MYREFYDRTLITPSVAEVEISNFPGESYIIIMREGTSTDKNDVNKKDVFYYCDNIIDFLRLFNKNNGYDFYITKLIKFN